MFFSTLQFLVRHPQSPVICWVDLMKCGRVTGQEVNDISETIAAILKKNPNSVALVVAPYLSSEKVAGYRAELRPMFFGGGIIMVQY